MKRFLFAGFLLLLVVSLNAQTKTVINAKQAGGFCNTYFDLGDQGFVLGFNQDREANDGSKALQHQLQYYSKDLTKRANFKVNTTGVLKISANKNYLFTEDIAGENYLFRVFDFTGKELNKKRIDLALFGLTQSMIERIHFTDKAQVLFETYDGLGDLHLFSASLLSSKDNDLSEIDWQRTSSQPLQSMNYRSEWKFLGSHMGYYMMARKGANAMYNPNAIAYHITFYDEDFQLFREYLLDNFLLPGSSLLGKDVSLSLNTINQNFVLSCLVKKGETVAVMTAAYGLGKQNNVMERQWLKELPIKDNAKYGLVDLNASTSPLPPRVFHKGKKVMVTVSNSEFNPNEEAINQLIIFDAQGNALYNEIQSGTFESLNLDNYCVDNNSMYSRLAKLQMTSVLKPICEQQNSDVIDIDIDAEGNELLIVLSIDSKKNIVTLYRFPKR
jgi:hypothetical protein